MSRHRLCIVVSAVVRWIFGPVGLLGSGFFVRNSGNTLRKHDGWYEHRSEAGFKIELRITGFLFGTCFVGTGTNLAGFVL